VRKYSIADRNAMGGGILFAAVLADAALSLSGPDKISLSELIAFLAFLTSLALLCQNTIVWPAGPVPPRLSAALALALFGLDPATIGAVRTAADGNLVASLTGVAAGIVICRWKPAGSWLRWASLLPAIPCMLLHRTGAALAPLLIASSWLFESPGVGGRNSAGSPARQGNTGPRCLSRSPLSISIEEMLPIRRSRFRA
jgi:hypothetical protein